MSAPLVPVRLAIPSKGRLKSDSEAALADKGLRVVQSGGERSYAARLDWEGTDDAPPGPMELVLAPAREIAEGLIGGRFHFGVTGLDLLHDLSPAGAPAFPAATVLEKLGFGHADVVVAVPDSWIDVATLADLDAAGALFRARHGRRLRIATKYSALSRRFLSGRAMGEFRLSYSSGATEAAPATGMAEAIIDITSTGSTLEANHLKTLKDGLILASEAVLAAGPLADWSAPAADALLRRLAPDGARLDGLPARKRQD